MSKTISKLNKLNNPASFIQVNTIKGFKYVDRAGEIVNSYHRKNLPPQFSMALNGLDIIKPVDKIEQLKITPETFWMKSEEVDSLDMFSSIFKKELEKVLKILEVEEVSRIGWRNYFIYEFADESAQKEYLKKFTVIDATNPIMVRLEIKTGKDFSANLILRPVIKNNTEKTPGVLFDIDLFKNGDTKVEEVYSILRVFQKYLGDENGFLDLINKTFK